ncbi:MFS transporter [Fonticella tunisiensis]|uniref:UMF1 family MFS transporter n=1 Tax=Fonticella tunisiensis TaxID=1096341 RepID=A0A4R7KAF3_9CLOT|nr:UMF1 family MFS transporter [Fonticella tunisiensis]
MTKQERSWVLYDWANSAYSITITTAVLPIFFNQFVLREGGSDTAMAYWAYGNSVSTLIIALLAPILGTISDYRGYKKKLFLFFFLMGTIFTGLLATINEGEWITCIIIYALTAIGFSGANVFYDAFIVDVTEEKKMDWISSLGFGYGYIGSTIPFIISIVFIMKPGLIGLSSQAAAMKLSFIITALWWFLFSIPMLKNVNQIYYTEPSKHPVKESFITLWKTIKNISGYKNIFIFLMAYFFYIDGVGTIIKMAGIYGSSVGIKSNDLLIILLVTQFVAFPFALLFGKLAKKFSAKTMIFAGIIIYTITTIYAYFLKTTLQYWIMAMLVATSQGGIQALSRSLFGRIIPKEKSSEFFGFYNIFGRFAAIMGPLLIGVFTNITGDSRLGVVSLIMLFIIGGIFLIKVKDESPNAYQIPSEMKSF